MYRLLNVQYHQDSNILRRPSLYTYLQMMLRVLHLYGRIVHWRSGWFVTKHHERELQREQGLVYPSGVKSDTSVRIA